MIDVVINIVVQGRTYCLGVDEARKLWGEISEALQQCPVGLNQEAEAVIDLVCAEYHVSRDQITGKRRMAREVRARHVCCYLLAYCLGITTAELGRGPIMHSREGAYAAIRSIEDQINTDARLADEIVRLQAKISAARKERRAAAQ